MPNGVSNRRSLDRASINDKELYAVHAEVKTNMEGRKGDAAALADRQFVEAYPDKDRRMLLRKMDLHIIPILISLYSKLASSPCAVHSQATNRRKVLSFIDRANIGNAQAEVWQSLL